MRSILETDRLGGPILVAVRLHYHRYRQEPCGRIAILPLNDKWIPNLPWEDGVGVWRDFGVPWETFL